jgi:AGZA family xanthine/uracil permease-like MFS transporter
MRQSHDGLWMEFVAGLTIFFTMAYAPFVNAIVLGKMGMPQSAVFYATCAAAVLGSALCGWFVKTPTALAPGMAFNAFLVQYVQSSQLSWPEALVICFVIGAALFIMSATGFRRQVIDAIPDEIKVAVIGGIGALLAQLGTKIAFPSDTAPQMSQVGLFIFGVAVIILFNVTLRGYAKKLKAEGSPKWSWILDIVGRSGMLISVGAVAVLAHQIGIGAQNVAADGCLWVWSCQPDAIDRAKNIGTHILDALPFAIFILYMLFADIVGSPYHLLPRTDPDWARRIDRSFLIDSGMNMVAPIMGTSPVVFYAENSAGQLLGGRSGYVAFWVAGCFALLAAVGLLFSAFDQPLFELVPQIAVAPALFTIGLYVIASSLIGSDAIAGGTTTTQPQFSNPEALLPAAVSIILTPSGLEYGLAGGLLAYYAYFIFVPKAAQPKDLTVNPKLHIFAFVALLAIIVKLAVS